MRIMREKSVYQLSFMPRFFPVNCYYIEEDDGLTLIDAALPYSAKAILQTANGIGKHITHIVLTHAHEDHVGALDKLKETLPHVSVYISQRDARLLSGDISLEPEEAGFPIRGGVPKRIKSSVDVLLNDGDRIGSLMAIQVPGHTPGSMAFLDTRNHAIIAGDAFQTKGGIAVSGQWKPWFPFPAMATWNREAALESARKLLSFNPTLLAVGHGDMLLNPVDAMGRAIVEAEKNLGKNSR